MAGWSLSRVGVICFMICSMWIGAMGFPEPSESGNYTEIDGMEFGSLRKFLDLPDLVVRHMEVDVLDPEVMIFSTDNALKANKGDITMTLAGSTNYHGYTEGYSGQALFNGISSFLQLNRSTMVLVDTNNHCLRLLNRTTLQTSPFVGFCTRSGYFEGRSARFHYPAEAILFNDGSHQSIVVADSANNVIRKVNIESRETSTLISNTRGLRLPHGLNVHPQQTYLIISDSISLLFFHLRHHTLFRIAGGSSQEYPDGSVSPAKFNATTEMIRVSHGTVAADLDNGIGLLRLFIGGSMAVICKNEGINREGPAGDCSILQPQSLLLHEGHIYIGHNGGISIIPLPTPPSPARDICQDRIEAFLDTRILRAPVRYTAPNGVKLTFRLRPGEYTYNHYIPAGGTCEVNIVVYEHILHRRFDIAAKYEMDCDLLENEEFVNDITAVEQTPGAMARICNDECTPFGDAQIRCHHNVTTLRWRTDMLLPDDDNIPPEVGRLLQLSYLDSHDFLLTLPNGTLQSPQQPAYIALSPVCESGFDYRTCN